MTLLTIVQGAAVRAGFSSAPSNAIGNQDQNVAQLVAFCQDTGRELVERENWVNLDTAGTVTGDGKSTLFQLPNDWMRFSPSDKCPHGALVSNLFPLLPLYGPVNTEELNLLKAIPATTVRPVWRIIGGALEIWPALAGPQGIPPGAGEIVTFNYYSSAWISNSARTVFSQVFTADDNFCLLNEDTVMKGAIWRWKAAKGLDYAEDFRAYELSFARNAGQQQTERTVSTSRKSLIGEHTYLGTISDLTSHVGG